MTEPVAPAPRGPDLLDAAALALAVGGFAFAAWIWFNGPTTPIPMHMDLAGNVDRWGDRREAGLVLAAVTLVTAAVYGLTAWVERTKPMTDAARRGLWFGRLIALITGLFVIGLIGGLSLGRIAPGEDTTPIVRGVAVLLSVVMLVVGGLLGKTTPNPWVGVRTYWSLTSRLAWDKSNRLLGRLWFLIGLVGLPAALAGPMPVTSAVIVGAMIVSAVLAVIESWRVWMADPERNIA